MLYLKLLRQIDVLPPHQPNPLNHPENVRKEDRALSNGTKTKSSLILIDDHKSFSVFHFFLLLLLLLLLLHCCSNQMIEHLRMELLWWPKTGWAFRRTRGTRRHAAALTSSYKFDSWKRFRFRFLVFVCPHFSLLFSPLPYLLPLLCLGLCFFPHCPLMQPSAFICCS